MTQAVRAKDLQNGSRIWVEIGGVHGPHTLERADKAGLRVERVVAGVRIRDGRIRPGGSAPPVSRPLQAQPAAGAIPPRCSTTARALPSVPARDIGPLTGCSAPPEANGPVEVPTSSPSRPAPTASPSGMAVFPGASL